MERALAGAGFLEAHALPACHEGLQPMERIHPRAYPEELQSVERTHDEAVQDRLSPMGSTPLMEQGKECEEGGWVGT